MKNDLTYENVCVLVMPLTIEHRTFLIEAYFRSGRNTGLRWSYSYQQCLNDFQENYPNAEVPPKSTLVDLIHRFRQTGSVHDKKSPGRPKRLSEDTLMNIRDRMDQSPKKSLRRLSAETGLSVGSCFTAVRHELHLYPYRIHAVHELLPTDFNKRVMYCNWFRQHCNDNLLDETYFTDESWIHLSGYVNRQNTRLWSANNPHFFTESPLHPLKIGIWVAVSPRRVIGPLFFEETLNSESYCALIDRFHDLLPLAERNTAWLQQDSATCHTSRATMFRLQELFGDRVIPKAIWPPRSPDLTPLDYFLFGYLKDEVFKRNPQTLDELRNYVELTIQTIDENVLHNVFQNMHKRIHLCLQVNGQHFQHLL